MNRKPYNMSGPAQSNAGFTLMEVMVAVALVVICFSSIFLAISMGSGILRTSREQERATQLEVEKLEQMRLYNWDQLNSNGFIPTTFTAYYDPTNTNGLAYYGTVLITNSTVTASYSNTLKLVTVQLVWTSWNGGTSVTQSMSTCVAKYGLQNYIY